MWGAIEVAPGIWDWDDYDRQLELGEKYGIQTIIAEVTHAAPEWAFRRLAGARYQRADGSRVESEIRNSSATGGFPGLCLDNDDARELAENFLTQLVTRYRDHPSLGGYDVWNECNLHSSGFSECFCAATQGKFRLWLRAKYGDLKARARAWLRFSHESWDDVRAPRQKGPYPECFDWAQFRLENAHAWIEWRTALVRRFDPRHFVSAHGVEHRALSRRVSGADDPWRAAALADVYGYTGGCSYYPRESEQWRRWSHADMARSGGQGKPFWAAERAAGPSWSARDTRARDSGRIPDAADLRVADFTALAAGATGLFSSRWRPLLDGPLFDHYAYYAMDGSPTPRSEMAATIAHWGNASAQQPLWQARPVRGEIGLLVVPEAQVHSTLLRGDSALYEGAVVGAYQAFVASNIQADYVALGDMGACDLLYLPAPWMLNEATAHRLKSWVAQGGRLVCEGLPGYWGDAGHAGVVQPNSGLDELFGAQQERAEWLPELVQHENATLRLKDQCQIARGGYEQAYRVTSGRAVGWFEVSEGAIESSEVAAVESEFGRGRTLLVGTSPGLGYQARGDAPTRAFFASLLDWAGQEPHVVSPDPRLGARLHAGPGGTFLWLVNSATTEISGELTLGAHLDEFGGAQIFWGEGAVEVAGRTVRARVPRLDALVLQLLPA